MTNNLTKKLLRDIKENFIQFLAIFVMCFLCMFILVGFESDREGMSRVVDEYLKTTNFMDLSVSSEAFSYQDLLEVEQISDIRKAELRYTSNGTVRVSGTDKKLEFNFIEENDISKMILYEGEAYSSSLHGIWIDRDFATLQKIEVGDILQLTVDSTAFSEPVKGIIDNPDHMFFIIDETYVDAIRGAYGYAFLPASEYPGKNIKYNRIFVDISSVNNQFYLEKKDKNEIKRMAERIRSFFKRNDLDFVLKQSDGGFSSISEDMKSSETLGTVFPGLFVLIALLGIVTTMTRLVNKQRTVIGTLKAIGFSQRKIVFHYISYPVVICIIGCIAGSFGGWWTLGKSLHDGEQDYYTLPHYEMYVSSRVIIAVIAIAVMAAAVTFLSCKKLLSQSASTILRSEAPTVTGAGFMEKTKVWKKLSFASRWNIRDINRNKLRTVGALAGITLCSMLMMAAFGINELWQNVENWQYEQLTPASYTIGFSDGINFDTVYEYATKYDGQMIMRVSTDMYGTGNTYTQTMNVVDKGNLFLFQNKRGEYMNLPEDGVAISAKAAKSLGVQLGDIVSFKDSSHNRYYKCRIRAIYKSPSSQGISMTRAYYESLGLIFTPNILYTNMTVPSSFMLSRDEIDSVFSKEEYLESLRRHRKVTSLEVNYIMIIAITIGIVVMYNLGVLSFVEKTREIATLKVLGFSTNKIRWILQQQNLTLTGLGTVVGIILGLHSIEPIMGQLDMESDFIINLSPVPYILSFLLTFVLSVMVNALISNMVKDINMVEALKGVE